MADLNCTNPTLQSPLNTYSKDKFIMILNLPYVLRKRASADSSLDINPLQISVYGTIVPDISVPEIDVKYAGQNFHVSAYARPNYPPLSINFVVDNDYKNYFTLWKWLDSMNLAIEDYYGGTANPTPTDIAMTGDQFEYQTTFSIIALNEYNSPSIEFKYHRAFISRLGGIQYSYRDGTLIESSADFHFSQLDVLKLPNQSNILTQ
jgi:hypothetical protein